LLGDVVAFNIKDFCAGLLFIGLGGVFASFTLMDLDLGTLARMGPGYFPLALSGMVIVMGFAVLGHALFGGKDHIGTVPWRPLVLILCAPIIFAATVRGLGFILAIILIASLAALASSRMNMLTRAVLVLGVTVFCYIVFYMGLGLSVRPFGTWLGT
jgi:hypothetical protein